MTAFTAQVLFCRGTKPGIAADRHQVGVTLGIIDAAEILVACSATEHR